MSSESYGDLAIVLGILAGVLLVYALAVKGRFAVYRATHPYTREEIRRLQKDSVKKSQFAVTGRVAEQLAPLLPAFMSNFNPRDARFLGSPVDFVVFDGLCEGDVTEIVFVEVKTGDSADLSKAERQIRRAVEEGRVRFERFETMGDGFVNGE